MIFLELVVKLPDVSVFRYLAQHLSPAVRIDGLHRHLLAPHMQVGPEAVDEGRLLQNVDALENLLPVRRNEDVAAPRHTVHPVDPHEDLSSGLDLGPLALRI